MSQSVVIKYGFGEGYWHSNQGFSAQLKQAGFIVTDNDTADIVVAHSGGCFFVPSLRDDQIVILINPPYWPGRKACDSFRAKLVEEFNDVRTHFNGLFWFRKTAWNILYSLRFHQFTKIIVKNAPQHKFHEALEHEHIVLIRNTRDTWCTPDVSVLPTKGEPFDYYEVPGLHDDLWEHPGPYIAIIKQAATLAS